MARKKKYRGKGSKPKKTILSAKEIVAKENANINSTDNKNNQGKLNEFLIQYKNYSILPVNTKGSDCLHDNCSQCNGTGMRNDGLGMCIHYISCPCKKCTPSYSYDKGTISYGDTNGTKTDIKTGEKLAFYMDANGNTYLNEK